MKLARSLLAAVLALAALCASAQLNPFQAVATTNVTVTGTAATLTLSTAMTGQNRQVVLSNVGTQTVFAVCDGVVGTAPTTATATNGMPIVSNTQVLVSLDARINACSAIAASTGSTLYATVGSGQ